MSRTGGGESTYRLPRAVIPSRYELAIDGEVVGTPAYIEGLTSEGRPAREVMDSVYKGQAAALLKRLNKR